MKKTVLYLIVCTAAIFCFAGCGTPTLDQYVSRIQRQLPTELGNGLTMSACEVDGEQLSFRLDLDENEFSLDDGDVQFVLLIMRETLTKEFMSDDTIRELLEQCKVEGKGFCVTMKGEKSGKSELLIDLSPEKLREEL